MKKVLKVAFILLLTFTVLLTACMGNKNVSDSETKESEPAKETTKEPTQTNTDTAAPESDGFEVTYSIDTSVSGEITLWSFLFNTSFVDVIPEFNKMYPNVTVNVLDVGFGELHDKLATSLAAGTGAPDIALIEEGQFGRYNYGDTLENLLEAPYNAGRLQDLVPEYNWDRWHSVDGASLFGMPWDITPGVTFYRTDILEQLGFPNDPEELGDYMEDPDNWIILGEALKADGRFLLEFKDLPLQWAANQYGYFNSDLEWMRNNDELVKMLDVSKRGAQIGLSADVSVFSEEGKQLMAQGKLPFIVLGSWGARVLQESVPDQSGKWQVTRMPLGLYGGIGGSSFVIPSQGENKEAAFAFVEWMNLSEESWKVFSSPQFSIQAGYKHIWEKDWYKNSTSEFLSDQRDIEFYSSLADKIPAKRLTRLDGMAWAPTWLDGILGAIDNNTDSKATLSQIEEDIGKVLKPEIDKLKAEINQ